MVSQASDQVSSLERDRSLITTSHSPSSFRGLLSSHPFSLSTVILLISFSLLLFSPLECKSHEFIFLTAINLESYLVYNRNSNIFELMLNEIKLKR